MANSKCDGYAFSYLKGDKGENDYENKKKHTTAICSAGRHPVRHNADCLRRIFREKYVID